MATAIALTLLFHPYPLSHSFVDKRSSHKLASSSPIRPHPLPALCKLRFFSPRPLRPSLLRFNLNAAFRFSATTTTNSSVVTPPLPAPPTDAALSSVRIVSWFKSNNICELTLLIALVPVAFGCRRSNIRMATFCCTLSAYWRKGNRNSWTVIIEVGNGHAAKYATTFTASITKAISAGMNEMRYVVFAPLGHATGRRVAVHLLDHILGLDLAFHLDRSTGVLARVMDRAQRAVIHIFRAVVFTFVPTAIELSLVCVLLAQKVSPAIAGIVFVTFLAYVWWTIEITRAAASSRKEANKVEELVTGKVVDALLNFEMVAQCNNQKFEVQQYDDLLRRYQFAMLDAERMSAALNAGQAFILATGVAIVMALAGVSVLEGSMTIGDLVLANGLILQLSGPLQFLGFLYRDLRQSLVDLDSLFNILTTKSSLMDGQKPLKKDGNGVRLRAHNLHFSYKSSRKILHGVSFHAEPGESLAIVGPSGSGKSTIVKLLLRLYDPETGSLFMDGLDLRSLTQASLRRAVAVVPQDTVLFNDTIFNNIAYSQSSASEAEVINAAKQARLHDAVMRMPRGYQTIVGERGLKLSGGEKQRVAIARAFLKAPRLLICDEATSALDSTTEAGILNTLKDLSAGRTCIFVAHRLSTIMHCDKILVMDGGIIVEQGKHQELLKKKGLYANMWSLQELEEKQALM